jgi:hypothetical protein
LCCLILIPKYPPHRARKYTIFRISVVLLVFFPCCVDILADIYSFGHF